MFLLQSPVICIICAVVIICGGAASTANAINVKHEYIDKFDCALIDDLPDDDPEVEIAQDVCHKLEQLKNFQAASAVSFINATKLR